MPVTGFYQILDVTRLIWMLAALGGLLTILSLFAALRWAGRIERRAVSELQ